MKVELNQIIKEIVSNSEFANPFCDEFDRSEFSAKYKYLIENQYKEYVIINKDKGIESINSLLDLNLFYEELMLQMEILIDRINLDKLDLIESIIALINFEYFSLVEKVGEN